MNGNTALHHASRNVHVRLVQLLCNRGADVSIRNKQGTQARGVKPWDGKRGWNLTPERWSQETKDSVRDIKNILQEAFSKQKAKKEQTDSETTKQELLERNERIKKRVEKLETRSAGTEQNSPRSTPTTTPLIQNRPFNNYETNDEKPNLIPRNGSNLKSRASKLDSSLVTRTQIDPRFKPKVRF